MTHTVPKEELEFESRAVILRAFAVLSDIHRGRQVSPDRIAGLLVNIDDVLGPDGTVRKEPKQWNRKSNGPVNGLRGVTRSTG